MSATTARVHFGEVMQQVVKQNEPVIVERAGHPQVVILSVAAYRQLQANQAPSNWQSLVAQSRQQIAAELKGAALPPSDEIIHQLREARDAEYANLR
jgi:prevent-host-death family protein